MCSQLTTQDAFANKECSHLIKKLHQNFGIKVNEVCISVGRLPQMTSFALASLVPAGRHCVAPKMAKMRHSGDVLRLSKTLC